MKLPDQDFPTVKVTRSDAAGYAAWGLPVWAFDGCQTFTLCGCPAAGMPMPMQAPAMPSRIPRGGMYAVMAGRCAVHLEFDDGSNPYLIQGGPEACRKELRRWARNYRFECLRPMDPEPGGILYLLARARR